MIHESALYKILNREFELNYVVSAYNQHAESLMTNHLRCCTAALRVDGCPAHAAQIPLDIWRIIAQNLEFRDKIQFANTCRTLRAITWEGPAAQLFGTNMIDDGEIFKFDGQYFDYINVYENLFVRFRHIRDLLDTCVSMWTGAIYVMYDKSQYACFRITHEWVEYGGIVFHRKCKKFHLMDKTCDHKTEVVDWFLFYDVITSAAESRDWRGKDREEVKRLRQRCDDLLKKLNITEQ